MTQSRNTFPSYLEALEREVPMTIGSSLARSAATAASTPRKLFHLILACVLAVSLAPSAAWGAPDAEAPADALSAEAQPGLEQPDGEKPAGEQPAEEVPPPVGEDAAGESAGDHAAAPEEAPASGDAPAEGEHLAPSPAELAEPAEPAKEGTPTEGEAETPAQKPAEGEPTDLLEASPIEVTGAVVGVDVNGTPQTWAAPTPLTLEEGATAADLSEALFTQVGITADTGEGAYGWYLNSITPPQGGDPLGSRETTPGSGVWEYWQLFVNGEYALTGAGGIVLQAGDQVTWCYGSDGTLPGQVAASCQVIGLDANGTSQVWAPASTLTMIEGETAADLTERAFAAAGLTADTGVGEWGWYLTSITSPFDANLTLGWNQATGRYWQLFVNGEYSLTSAGDYVLKPGDEIAWCYAADGEGLPTPGEVVPNPDAPRPNFDSAWPGFAGGVVENRPTPSESADLAWSYGYTEGAGTVGASEPLVVNGDVYLVVVNELRKISGVTGEVLARTPLGGSISYCCRPVYADGMVVVPVDDGSLTAFTADALVCVWKTPALSTDGFNNSYQALSSLTVSDGNVYAAFTMVGAGGVGTVGTLVCTRLTDGAVLWTRTTGGADEDPAGYYWAGAAASGDDVLIGGEAGAVQLLDGATGEVLASVDLGAPCRAGIVSAGDGVFLAVTTDGRLHRIVRSGNALTLTGSVAFAASSKSTPAVAAGKAFVCGVDGEWYGTLSVIDLATLTVDYTVRGTLGEALSSPLVSVGANGTYVYFTCNGTPGGVFSYRVGDAAAHELFVPQQDNQNYCMASVAADEFGNLYYTNDSGTLFKLVASQGGAGQEGEGGEGGEGDPPGTGNGDGNASGNGTPTQPNSVTHGARKPLGGTISATHAPLLQKTDKADASKKERIASASVDSPSAKPESGTATSTSATGSEDAGAVNDAPWTATVVNPWAVAGIALGVVGLAGAVVAFVRIRRKEGGRA